MDFGLMRYPRWLKYGLRLGSPYREGPMNKCLVFAALASGTAAAAQGPALVKGPVPTAPLKDWLAAGDAGAAAPGSDVAGTVHFALTISAQGEVIRCTVERS